MITFAELKSYLKKEAAYIKELKKQRKAVPNGYVLGLLDAKFKFRVHHVAYCLLRGRSYEEIENPGPNCGPERSKQNILNHANRIMPNVLPRPLRQEVQDGQEAKIVCGS